MAVCAAVLVAIAEMILFMIWDARKGTKSKNVRRRAVTKVKKDGEEVGDIGDVSASATSTALHESGLRHRTTDNTSVTDS